VGLKSRCRPNEQNYEQRDAAVAGRALRIIGFTLCSEVLLWPILLKLGWSISALAFDRPYPTGGTLLGGTEGLFSAGTLGALGWLTTRFLLSCDSHAAS